MGENNIVQFNLSYIRTTHDMIEILNKNQINEKTIFNFSKCQFIRPFALLLMYQTINKNIQSKVNFIPSNKEYFKNMGLYDLLNQNYEFNERTDRFKIYKYNINDFYYDNKLNTDKITETSKMFSNLLINSNYYDKYIDFFMYFFREIFRNAIEHSYGRSVVFYATVLPKKNMFEFAIFDDGRGIEYSLRKNSKLIKEINKGKNVIDLAMNPGVSSFSNYRYLNTEDSKWKNSGFGLSIVKEFCMRLQGEFIICSNNELRIFNSYTKVMETHRCDIKGVGIQVRFVYDKNFDYKKMFDEIINDLEKSSGLVASEISKIKKL